MICSGDNCMKSLFLGLGSMAIAVGIGTGLSAERRAFLRRSLRAAGSDRKEERRSEKHG